MKSISPFEEALAFVKKRWNENTAKIKANLERSKKLLDQEKIEKIVPEVMNDDNKKLLTENQDLLNIQKLIQDYMAKYVANNPSLLSFDECLEYTIKGILPLDEEHPWINNSENLNKLMEYYTKAEDYEMCNYIVNLISAIE